MSVVYNLQLVSMIHLFHSFLKKNQLVKIIAIILTTAHEDPKNDSSYYQSMENSDTPLCFL